ncbi:MAG: hypothetical protein HZY76_21650 [Anaerolineae bacterium]|nr:MAG: hypothetical protein HZY76_21650 [Anaerolineae bacterium]
MWGYRLRLVNEATGESFTSPQVSGSNWYYSTIDYRLFLGTPAPTTGASTCSSTPTA